MTTSTITYDPDTISDAPVMHFAPQSPFYNRTVLWDFAPRKREKLGASIGLRTALLGIISATLYLLLFKYQGDIVHFAELTRQGHKIDFIIPILIALVFSLVHGAFTGHFWGLLGLKPKQQTQQEA